MSTPHEASTASAQRVVASYPNQRDAESAVDHLSEHAFPVERTAIVGRGLEMVGTVTGRITYFTAGVRGLASGAVAGAVIGWLFGLFAWVDPLVAWLLLAVYGLLLGAVVGAVIGLLGHALTAGRRDFGARSQFRASSYDVLVDADVAEDAAQLLTPGHQQ